MRWSSTANSAGQQHVGITEAIAALADEVLPLPGVEGVAEGESNGEPVIVVMAGALRDAERRKIPDSTAGYRVVIRSSGPLRALTAARCPWVPLDKPDYVAYHDAEWGVPVHDDLVHFEFLLLEGAQAGLSWYTVLRKRAAYRTAFCDFDPTRVADFTDDDVAGLMHNSGLIRNRQKLSSAVSNAKAFVAVQNEFGSFDDFVWSFVGGRPIVNELRTLEDYPSTSVEAETLSRELRRRGFKFVGPTIVYAHMQATGLVNDHTVDCFRRDEIMGDYPGTA